MIPGDSRDSVKIDFQRRTGILDVPTLTLVSFEKTYFGVSGGQKYPILSDSVTIPLSGKAEDFGCYVVSSEELIDFEFFSGFCIGFNIDIFTGYATKEIHKPGSSKTSIVDVRSHSDTVRIFNHHLFFQTYFHPFHSIKIQNYINFFNHYRTD